MKLSELARHEFIGLTIKITQARNKDLEGLQGKVINETKNSFVIKGKGAEKMILKNQLLEIMIVENEAKIPAKLIRKRPEERIKI